MMKSKRFEPIQEIASSSAKDLSRPMAEAAHKVAELEKQLQQLQKYRDEYVRNSTQASGSRANAQGRSNVSMVMPDPASGQVDQRSQLLLRNVRRRCRGVCDARQ